VAAVPAPLPLGAAVGGGHGVYVPVQLVGGACGKDLMVEKVKLRPRSLEAR